MFEKYGEFNSADELNVAAATALEQGDLEGLKKLAEENGIDVADAEDYADGYVQELCTPLIAAIGKIHVETASLNLPLQMEGWVTMINEMLSTDNDLCRAVRKKGKRIVDVFGILLKKSSENRKLVPDEIVKAAGKGLPSKVYVGDVDKPTFKQIVRDYYYA